MALSPETTAPRFSIFAVPGPNNRPVWDVFDRNCRVSGDFTSKEAAEVEMTRLTRRAMMTPEQQRQHDIQQEKNKEAQAARIEGAMYVLTVLSETNPKATPQHIENGLYAAYNHNPHQMVSYADEGHKRPAWFEGFNAGINEYFGVGQLPETEGFKNVRYGRKPDNVPIKSYEDAMDVAKHLNDFLEKAGINAVMWAEDRGENVSPRYAVIRGFRVGDPVSYGFNGDSYIAGRVVRLSSPCIKGRPESGCRIITVALPFEKEYKHWRRALTGSWKRDQTWSLMRGWWFDRNPSF